MNTLLSFSLPAVSGGNVNALENFPDAKAFVIYFTCNHCPYAVAWEDRIIAIENQFSPKGIPVIAISSNDVVKYPQDSFERMTERANEKHFPFPYLFDESQEIARNFKAEKTPHVFVVTRSGELIFEGAIDDNYKDAAAVQQHYLADALNAFLKGEPPVNAKVNAVGCSIKWKG